MEEAKFVVRQSSMVLWAGIIGIIIPLAFIVLMSVFPNDTAEWWVYLIFFLMVFLGAALFLYYLCWVVRVDGEKIHFTSILKPTKTFTFSEIQKLAIVESSEYQKITLYSESEKLFSMDTTCKGYHLFAARLMQEREKMRKVQGMAD